MADDFITNYCEFDVCAYLNAAALMAGNVQDLCVYSSVHMTGMNGFSEGLISQVPDRTP